LSEKIFLRSIQLEDLLVALTSGDEERAEAAAGELAFQGEAALPALQELLSSPEAEHRWWATRTLADIKDSQVVPLLLAALQDAKADVRHCAAVALRLQPSPQAIPGLVATLGDEDRLLARLASDALVAAGNEAVPALLEVMQKESLAACLEAIRALARIGDPSSIPALFAALDGDSAIMEHWANEGLERMGVGMSFFQPEG
jgi:HEAT repeat protein